MKSSQRKSVKSIREKDIEDENSPEFLRWQVKILLSKNLKASHQFVDQCVKQEQIRKRLQNEIEALAAELQSVKEERKSLKDRLQVSLNNEETAKKTIGDLNNDIEKRKKRAEKLTQEFSQYRESSEKKEEELREKLNYTQAKMEEERERLNKAINEQQKDIRRVKKIADALKTECNHLRDSHKKALAKFKLILEIKGTANGVLHEMLHTIEADLKEKELEKIESYKRRLNLKDEKIRKLEELKELEGIVKDLYKKLEEKYKTIEAKDSEIETMVEEMRDIVAKHNMKGQMAAVLQCKLTEAEEQIQVLEEAQGQRDLTTKNLLAEKLQSAEENQMLRDTLAQCKNRLRLSEKNKKKLDRKVRELERYQAQFRADLNTCVSVIGKPKEVRMKLAALKRRYIHDELGIKLAKNTEAEYQNRIRELQHKLDCQMKICHNREETMKKMQHRMESLDTVAAAREIHYIQLLNTEITKTQDLQKKLHEEN